ncbi:MAG: hypothetical protein JSS83_19335 [Cyanobacteria bacterium SZAS LIN-3]|nr:hypothetical protein [Cyanobacteria bacterium SZAS LIN-3]MBS2010330.1 hypothetical protein [Cyanobacteria bacterium SZAS TMP-1]
MKFVIGIFLGLIAAAFVQGTVVHQLGQGQDGASLVAIVAGLWAAWPLCARGLLERKAFLHPPVRRYQMPAKHAFAKVRQVLTDSTYNYGDKWFVSTADNDQLKLVACLRFTDEEMRMEGTSVSRMTVRKERKQRLLELEVQLEKEPGNTTLIQFDFRPKVEGLAWHACDRIVFAFLHDVQVLLGLGEEAYAEAKEPVKLVPPWWLLAITVLGLMSFTGAVGKHMEQNWQKVLDGPKEVERQKADELQTEESMRDEIAAWKKFKEIYNVR